MDRYKFRGKRLDNGEWVCGNLLIDNDLEHYFICGYDYYNGETGPEREAFSYRVDPPTVGQYTGLKDKNGKEIYEGDIVKVFEVRDYDGGLFAETYITDVAWEDACFVSKSKGCDYYDTFFGCYIENGNQTRYPQCELEVIGNIHDNPSLLKGE